MPCKSSETMELLRLILLEALLLVLTKLQFPDLLVVMLQFKTCTVSSLYLRLIARKGIIYSFATRGNGDQGWRSLLIIKSIP